MQDIKNYSDGGQCHLPKRNEVLLIEVSLILDIRRTSNPIIA